MKCAGTNGSGDPCRFSATSIGDGTLCLNCAGRAGLPEACEELSRRGSAGRAKQSARAQAQYRDRVPLGTVAEIREWLEQLAATAERGKGDVVAKTKACTAVATQALALLKDDLEKHAAELAELLKEHPQVAAKMKTRAPVLQLVPDGEGEQA